MNRKAFVLEDIPGINAKQTNRGVYTYTYMPQYFKCRSSFEVENQTATDKALPPSIYAAQLWHYICETADETSTPYTYTLTIQRSNRDKATCQIYITE